MPTPHLIEVFLERFTEAVCVNLTIQFLLNSGRGNICELWDVVWGEGGESKN